MAYNSNYYFMVSNQLLDYFKNNLKLSLKIDERLFIITRDDIFYMIVMSDENLTLFIKNNDNSILESMKVKELCYKNIVDLSYGFNHYIARTNKNEIYCWGNNYFGQLGDGNEDNDSKNYNKPILNAILSGLEIEDIKCGAFHSIALTKTGEMYVWGSNENGQIGSGCNFDYHLKPTKVIVSNEERIKSVSCGFQHSLALTASNKVFGWGDNSSEQLSDDEEEYSNKPKLIETYGVLINKISCGPFHSLLLTENGVILAIGNCFQFRIDQLRKKKLESHILSKDKRYIDIASHWNQNISIGLSSDNIFYVWKNFGEDDSLTATQAIGISFNELFAKYSGNNLEPIRYFSRNGVKAESLIPNKIIEESKDNNFRNKSEIDSNHTISSKIFQNLKETLFLKYENIIFDLHRGDLIEIDRGKYTHWALFESIKNANVWCFHVSKVPDFKIKRKNISEFEACIRYEPLKDILLIDERRISLCRINNQISKAEKLMRKEGIKSPPDINSIIDELHKIVETLHTVDYHPKKNNCEHFVTKWKYGIGFSIHSSHIHNLIEGFGNKTISAPDAYLEEEIHILQDIIAFGRLIASPAFIFGLLLATLHLFGTEAVPAYAFGFALPATAGAVYYHTRNRKPCICEEFTENNIKQLENPVLNIETTGFLDRS